MLACAEPDIVAEESAAVACQKCGFDLEGGCTCEMDELEAARCVWCGGYDCTECEAEFDEGARRAAERSGM